jgi:hypothetical protein
MADQRSLSERRQEAERARANLAQTVDELKAKASPTGMKEALGRTVRDNPLPAVALGVAAVYPLLKLVRSAPAPLLMLGAGLFLSGTAAGRDASRKATAFGADATDKLSRIAADVAATAKERANVGLAAAREQASAATDMVASSMAVVRDKATAAADATAETQAKVSGAAGDAWAQVPSRDQLKSTLERTGATAAENIRQNPLLVGGVGLAIGALLASALPSSRVEDEWVGDAAERVKGGARQAAARGFEHVKEAASAAMESAAEQAEENGLSPEGLKSTAADYAERARKVANSALDEAAQAGEKQH